MAFTEEARPPSGPIAPIQTRFLRFVGKPLRSIKLADVQAFADSIADRAPATQARAVNVIKSLLSFAHRVGYLPFNVAVAVKAPPAKDTRAERILPETEIQEMLALERHPPEIA